MPVVNSVDAIYKGADAVDRVYRGADLVYEPASGEATQVILATAGAGVWEVPADFDSANNKIELIGSGGRGGQGGGGGGQYSRLENRALTPGASINFQVGIVNGTRGTAAAPGTGDTWFEDSATIAYAQAGTPGGTSNSSWPGGNATPVGSCITRNGGSGGVGHVSSNHPGGGGGGAGGPSGVGGNGSVGLSGSGGGGGGANGGENAQNNVDGGDSGSGGAGGLGSFTGTAGEAGVDGGGGGGGDNNFIGGAGSTEPLWDSEHGPGGGGGGGGLGSSGVSPTNAGGNYGGGGGGRSRFATTGGDGGQGIIVITYGGPPPPPPTAYSYYRIRATDTNGTNDAIGWRELAFYTDTGVLYVDDVGGTDTAIASYTDASYPPSNAFDGNTTSFWTSFGVAHGGPGHWCGIQLGTPRAFVGMNVRSRGDFNETPQSYVVEGSEDGVAWTTLTSGGAIPGNTPTDIYW